MTCTRRQFLRGALASAALTITPLPILRSASAASNAFPDKKFLVVVNLLGGNDGLNTIVPAHLQPYVDRRPALNLLENSAEALLDLDGRYRLHPALAGFKGMWDAGDLHVVHKVGYPNQNLSHFTSQNIYSFGVRDIGSNGDGRGWLGRFADTYCADPVEPLGVVAVGMGRPKDVQADVTDALTLDTVAGFDFREDRDWRTDHALRRIVARRVLEDETPPEQPAALAVFGSGRQAHELAERVQSGTAGWVDPGTYPGTTLGNRLKEVSRLLHGRDDFGTKVFYTGFGGFDTHSDQLGRHASLLAQLDGAVGAFADDMKAKGMWEDCVVVVISEFGRRNFENGSRGTDHGHGNAFFVAGGGVSGGAFTGDLVEADLEGNQPDFSYDFREVYADLVENHLGVPPDPLFPETYPRTGDIRLL
mgnify:FL=1